MEEESTSNKTFLENKNDNMKSSYYFIDGFIKNKELKDVSITMLHSIAAIYCNIKINNKITLKCYSTTEEKLNVVYFEYGQESSNEIYGFHKNMRTNMSLDDLCELIKNMDIDLNTVKDNKKEVKLIKNEDKKEDKKELTWFERYRMSKVETEERKEGKEEINPPKDENDIDINFWDDYSSSPYSQSLYTNKHDDDNYFNISKWWKKNKDPDSWYDLV